jgi:hypothetical protein
MKTLLCLWMLAVVSLSLVGCQTPMIPMHNLYGQNISGGLSQDEIQGAIRSGAMSAGWRIGEKSDGQMFATYGIRTHVVTVSIGYSDESYGIYYQNSHNMKVRCGTRPSTSTKPDITAVQNACPGGTTPTYIHRNYKEWIEGLNRSISAALRSACFADKRCRS